MVPIITLAARRRRRRSMFGGAYVVDNFALVFKGAVPRRRLRRPAHVDDLRRGGRLLRGRVLLPAAVVDPRAWSSWRSARDLITIFVALEMLSIPAYMLAGWRKRDLKSNEASLKYYLLGVLASAVMLYGMSLIFGVTGTTVLADIGEQVGGSATAIAARHRRHPVHHRRLRLQGLGRAVPLLGARHLRGRAHAGHRLPVGGVEDGGLRRPASSSSSSASSAAHDVWGPLFWVLAALTMTVGNLIALRQTNIVRMLAYSSIAQAGYILVPFAVAGDQRRPRPTSAMTAGVVYLLIYAAMNLGAFAVVIAVARKTRSGEISSLRRAVRLRPRAGRADDDLPVLARRHPAAGGWWAKFFIFRAVLDAGTPCGRSCLGVVAAVNSVIALFYYAAIAREMWMSPVPDGDRTPIRVPPSLAAALGITASSSSPSASTRRSSPASATWRRWCRRAAVAESVAELARRHGPLRFDEVVELALYDPDGGFYEPGGGAGRRGADFLTSPEVGPLFGAVVARALDGWWDELGEPDPFVVVEAGAGPGTLAACASLAARRRPCCAGPARTCWCERSAATSPSGRGRRGSDVDRRPTLADAGRRSTAWSSPTSCSTTCRSASCERTPSGWDEVVSSAPSVDEVLRAGADDRRRPRPTGWPPTPPSAARIPLQHQAAGLAAATPWRVVRRGRVVVVDYADTTPSMAAPAVDRLAAHLPGATAGAATRSTDLGTPGHHRARSPSTSSPPSARPTRPQPGRVPRAPTASTSWSTRPQAAWQERAAIGDLEALQARSRVTEAAALTDPAGLGAFTVLEWRLVTDASPKQRRPIGSRAMADADDRSRPTTSRTARSRRSEEFVKQRPRRRRLAARRGRDRLRGVLGPPGRRAARLVRRLGHDPRVGPAVRQVVRRRHAQRLATTASTATSPPARATRSPSTGRASRATPAPSPTPSCSTRCSASPTC